MEALSSKVFIIKFNLGRTLMLLNHQKYQSSFDEAMACAVECEHCTEFYI